MEHDVSSAPRVTEVSAVIIRADGTVHDIGLIVHDDPRLHRRLWWRVVGKRRSERRIAAANAYALEHRSE